MRVLLTPQARGVKSSEVIVGIIAGPQGIDELRGHLVYSL